MYIYDCSSAVCIIRMCEAFIPSTNKSYLSLTDVDNTILEGTKVTALDGILHSNKCTRLLAGVQNSSTLDHTKGTCTSSIALLI